MVRPNREQALNNKSVVTDLRKSNPCMTLQQIGDKVGMSREGVRQLLAREDLQTKSIKYGFSNQHECIHCGKLFKGMKSRKNFFCSRACWSAYSQIPIICDVCGKLFTRYKSRILVNIRSGKGKGDHVFCSKQCQGIWAGKNYGFGAHPENAGRRKYCVKRRP